MEVPQGLTFSFEGLDPVQVLIFIKMLISGANQLHRNRQNEYEQASINDGITFSSHKGRSKVLRNSVKVPTPIDSCNVDGEEAAQQADESKVQISPIYNHNHHITGRNVGPWRLSG